MAKRVGRASEPGARWLKAGERLWSYPWSSFGAYLAAPGHRPGWIQTDRLLGEHGIQADMAAGRERFEQGMERRREERPTDLNIEPRAQDTNSTSGREF